MKISINRLKDYIPFDQSSEEIAELLTASGLEVEGISKFESIKGSLEGIVIGEIVSCSPHPNADKLSLTKVDVGGEVLPIVCGAPNVSLGQKVPVALVGTSLYGENGDAFVIKKTKIRGEVSHGMICAEDELGLGENHDGIMVLDTDLPNGTPANRYFEVIESDVLEIGLTPNRADAASHLGVARDLRALLKKEITLPDVSDFKTDNHGKEIKVSVESSEDCPRYAGLTITGIKIGPSPKWLQNYLRALDLEPINNVVDITNFILHDLGQPLHAFDADKIKGGQILVMRMAEGTTFVTLDGKERKLSGEELMICDVEGGLCMAGILGGLDSGVSDGTSDIFLESACFSSDIIRKGGQYHGIKTDASFRFERGTDPNMPVFALKRAALLICELTGGKVSSPIADIYPHPVQDFSVPVKYSHVDRLIGKKLDREEIKSILRALEIAVEDENEEGFTAKVKPYRVDVTREADIIEEILRIYGFEEIKLQETYRSDYLAEHPEKDENKLQYRVSEMFAAQGFQEMITNSLTKQFYSEKSGYLKKEKDVEILNKLSEDLGVLRQTLLFTGLEVLAYNINRRQKDLRFYEFGSVYSKTGGEYKEKKMLSLFITGALTQESWLQTARPVGFPDLYAVSEALLTKLNLEQTEVEMIEEDPFDHALLIRIGKKEIGRIGLLRDHITSLAEVKQEVYYGSFNWGLLAEMANGLDAFREVSKFPEVRRDLSLVIDKSVTFDRIRQLSVQTGGKLLKRINVFDVYKGDKIDDGKKAYALSFYLQDNQQTLTDKVIDKTMRKLMQAFENEIGALIRK